MTLLWVEVEVEEFMKCATLKGREIVVMALFLFYLALIASSSAFACDEVSDSQRYLNRPAKAIAETDPLLSCAEAEEAARNGGAIVDCDPNDAVGNDAVESEIQESGEKMETPGGKRIPDQEVEPDNDHD
jgi:hypothetical protein